MSTMDADQATLVTPGFGCTGGLSYVIGLHKCSHHVVCTYPFTIPQALNNLSFISIMDADQVSVFSFTSLLCLSPLWRDRK